MLLCGDNILCLKHHIVITDKWAQTLLSLEDHGPLRQEANLSCQVSEVTMNCCLCMWWSSEDSVSLKSSLFACVFAN